MIEHRKDTLIQVNSWVAIGSVLTICMIVTLQGEDRRVFHISSHRMIEDAVLDSLATREAADMGWERQNRR